MSPLLGRARVLGWLHSAAVMLHMAMYCSQAGVLDAVPTGLWGCSKCYRATRNLKGSCAIKSNSQNRRKADREGGAQLVLQGLYWEENPGRWRPQ